MEVKICELSKRGMGQVAMRVSPVKQSDVAVRRTERNATFERPEIKYK